MRYTKRQYTLMLVVCLTGIAATLGVLFGQAQWAAVLAVWLLVINFGVVLDARQQVRQVAQRARRIHQKLDRLSLILGRIASATEDGPTRRWQTSQDSRHRRLLAAVESLRVDLVDDRKDAANRDQAAHVELIGAAETLQSSLLLQADRLMKQHEQLDAEARSQLLRVGQDVVQQTEALFELRAMTSGSPPMPLSGGWAMAPSTILHVLELISRERPRCILELGSGTSTAWLRATLRSHPESQLVSLDHDQTFAGVTRAHVGRVKGLDNWEVRAAPLEEMVLDEVGYNWYAPSSFSDLWDIDMLIVDGPPKATGPRARYPAFPALRARLAPGALIVLDDTHRDDERRIVQDWLAEGDLELADVGMWPGRHTVLRYTPSGKHENGPH